jgi:hypothetical protein
MRCDISDRSQIGGVCRQIGALNHDVASGPGIVVGLLSLPWEGAARLVKRIRESQACKVYTSLDEALEGT